MTDFPRHRSPPRGTRQVSWARSAYVVWGDLFVWGIRGAMLMMMFLDQTGGRTWSARGVTCARL
eukprot:3379107-Prymnesium_polylepis.1